MIVIDIVNDPNEVIDFKKVKKKEDQKILKRKDRLLKKQLITIDGKIESE